MTGGTKKRVLKEAEYFLSTSGATVRSTAEHFGEVTKSTVHRDLTEILPQCAPTITVVEVLAKLNQNLLDSPKRGGEATKRKYSK